MPNELDPRLEARTGYQGMSEATPSQKLALQHPGFYDWLKGMMSDTGIGPQEMAAGPIAAMIPTESNLPKFMKLWSENVGKNAANPGNPSIAEQMISWWKTRHPGLTKDINIKPSSALPSNVRGRYSPSGGILNGNPVIQVNNKIATSKSLPPSWSLIDNLPMTPEESTIESLGHENTHHIQNLRNNIGLNEYMKAGINPQTDFSSYFNHPLEQQARQGGRTAGDELQKFTELLKSVMFK